MFTQTISADSLEDNISLHSWMPRILLSVLHTLSLSLNYYYLRFTKEETKASLLSSASTAAHTGTAP